MTLFTPNMTLDSVADAVQVDRSLQLVPERLVARRDRQCTAASAAPATGKLGRL
jgi:hypothetical protein